MALRNTKIARDIIQSCNKLISTKYEVATISTKKSAENREVPENIEESGEHERYRYILSHTTKPTELPKLVLRNDLVDTDINYLQPAMQQKYLEIVSKRHNEYDWEARDCRDRDIECPFPEPIKQLRTQTLTREEQQKNSLDLTSHLKKNKLIINRSYSTSPFLLVSRSYTKKKKSDYDKCEPKKKVCKKNLTCPNFVMENCPERQETHCYHNYQDPKCTKKYAPYPSYSEKCVENLPDDPSECYQCPWQKCGGVDNIKPPKRNYHTTCEHFNMAMIPNKESITTMFPFYKHCDASKEPCKEPPSKCERLKKKQDKEKCPEKKKKDKKKCQSNWTTAYALWHGRSILPNELESLECDSNRCTKFPFDKRQADYNHVSKRKCVVKKNPKCNRRKKIRVPSCDSGDCKRYCIDATQDLVYDLKKCPESEEDKCRRQRERKCPKVDLTINEAYKPKDPCCEDHNKNKMIVRKHRRKKPRVYVPKSNRCL